MNEVKIIGKAPFATEIYINDKKVEGVSSYTLSQGPGEIAVLNLKILAGKLDINTPFVVKKEEDDSLADESTL